MLAENHIKYTAFETDCPSCTPLTFNFDADPKKMAYMGRILNATSPDLKKFNAKGGRMIIYQGWADPTVTPLRTIEYYESVIKEMGGLEKTRLFCRLYMVPGMAHCNAPPGVGPDQFDLLKPLEDWVEKGIAPEQIVASQTDKEGHVTRTRPLYPYPKVATYNGTGSTDDAANFTCQEP
jgi:feruloyl esterase